MTQDINQDSFGNTYFNYFDALSNGFVGYNRDTIFTNFLLAAFGANKYIANDGLSGFAITPSNSDESITSNTSASLYRFSGNLFQNTYHYFNTNSSNNNTKISVGEGGSGGFVAYIPSQTSDIFYAIANNRSLVIAALKRHPTTGLVDPTSWRFGYLGWLKDPGFAGSLRTRNCSVIHGDNGGGTAFRPQQENQTPISYYANSGSTANYSITCTNSTSSPSTTDLILRDASSPYYAIGSCYNLLKSSASLAIGQLYDIPNTVDSNTEQKRFLCVGNWGSEKLLMRVWTEGF